MRTVCGFVLRKWSARNMHGSSLRQCREHAVWTLVSDTCTLHLTVAPLVAAYAVWSGFSPCAYAYASIGVGSLVGRELAQSLLARLFVSVSRRAGTTRNLVYILFYIHHNSMNF